MLRPTKDQLNAAIVDHAAALFAVHGFEHTSVQQIADAIGYSKAGLLHRFPSKQVMYDAVLDALRRHVEDMAAQAKAIPVGIERDRAIVHASIDFAIARPGISAFGNRIAVNPDPDDQALTKIGLLMYEALGLEIDKLQPERMARVTFAFTGLCITMTLAVKSNLQDHWRDHIVATAMNALGH